MKRSGKILGAVLSAVLASAMMMTSVTAFAESSTEAAQTEAEADSAAINMAVLAGPTGVGASVLMDENDKGETANHYSFTVAAQNDEVTAGLLNGSLDIAAVATNVASNLYNKSEGQVQILAVNTLGVLYVLENGDTVHSVADLKGKKILSVGQGANPEYVLEYILDKNGLTWSSDGSAADVQIQFGAPDEVTAAMVSGKETLAMLPVPAVTAVMIQNPDVRSALNISDEWTSVSDGGELPMGCIAGRKDFLEQNPEAVSAFLDEYSDSIDQVLADPKAAGSLCEKYGIVPKAPIAVKAIPDCNLVCRTGEDVRKTVEPYYQVLFDANPKAIGGQMPGDDFYYSAK